MDEKSRSSSASFVAGDVRPMSGLRVRVDHAVCVGNAMCRSVAPKVFVAESDNRSSVADPDADSRDKILEAAALCPVGAIVVEDATTGEPVDY